jgi:hypothetical protein
MTAVRCRLAFRRCERSSQSSDRSRSGNRCRRSNNTTRREPDDTDADGEVSTRPADDPRECRGCFGAIAPSLDASRPSPCSLGHVVPPLRRATRLAGCRECHHQVEARYGVTSRRRRWHNCRSRRNGPTIQPRDYRSRVARAAGLFPLREPRYRYGGDRHRAALKRETGFLKRTIRGMGEIPSGINKYF